MKLEGGYTALQWCHNEHDGVSNHGRIRCLLNRLFSHRSKKTSKLHVTGLCACCEGNSTVTSEFPAQRVSNVKNVSIWWRHHAGFTLSVCCGMVVGIVVLCWTTMVVGSRSFNASHRRSTGLLLLWWWAVVVSMLLIEDQPYYCNGRLSVLLEDQLYHQKMNCCVGRSNVSLEDQLYYLKINCDVGRSVVLLDQLYWRQSTGIDRNYRSRKITARRWLHKYVGAECSASSFTWYLYQIWDTGVRQSICLSDCGQNCVCSVSSTILAGSISYLHILSSNRRCGACKFLFEIKKWAILANSLNL